MKSSTLRASTKPQLRKCAYCRQEFEKQRMGQKVCGPKCAVSLVATQNKKRELAADRKKREELKSYADWIADVQVVFNRYIRLRDAGKLCICCGKPFQPQKFGGSMDAGHYRSRGSAPHLRFDEMNVNGQRKNCNRPGGTTHAAFRAGMIVRYGLEAVERLEADQEPRHWTIEDLKGLKKHYQAKCRELAREVDIS